jgi:hypothetical protein
VVPLCQSPSHRANPMGLKRDIEKAVEGMLPRRHRLIEDLFGPSGRGTTVGVGTASGGGKSEGNPARRGGMTDRTATMFPHVKGGVAGTGFEPV